jgi:hypothetical protein
LRYSIESSTFISYFHTVIFSSEVNFAIAGGKIVEISGYALIHTKSNAYRLIRTKTPLDVGIINGDRYRISTIERSIVEGFKLASKIGERTAIKAARVAIEQKLTTINKIGVMAKKLGLDSYFTKYFEAIIGAIS